MPLWRQRRAARRALDEVVLATTGLTKRYSKRLAVNGLSLDVQAWGRFWPARPEWFWQIDNPPYGAGPGLANGWQHLALWRRPQPERPARAALRRVGAVVEQPAFYPYLSGRQNLRGVAIFAGLHNSPETRKRVDEAIGYVGLSRPGR